MKKYPTLLSVALILLLLGGCASLKPSDPVDDPLVEEAAEPVIDQSLEEDLPALEELALSDSEWPELELPEPPPAAPLKDQGIHAVIRGDTLSAIGRKYGVSVLQLQYRNEIYNPRSLKVGRELVIPDQRLLVPSAFVSEFKPFIWPLKQFQVTSEFGSRNRKHKGIDLKAPKGTPILASADGVVHFAGKQRGYGNVVVLKHANRMQTLYAHNDSNLVNKGQRVKKGDKIATVGRTGRSTGYHLHFEVVTSGLQQNPRRYLVN